MHNYLYPRWPFLILSESKLIRFIEWIMDGKDHMQTIKLLLNLEKWFSPYTLKVNQDQ